MHLLTLAIAGAVLPHQWLLVMQQPWLQRLLSQHSAPNRLALSGVIGIMGGLGPGRLRR